MISHQRNLSSRQRERNPQMVRTIQSYITGLLFSLINQKIQYEKHHKIKNHIFKQITITIRTRLKYGTWTKMDYERFLTLSITTERDKECLKSRTGEDTLYNGCSIHEGSTYKTLISSVKLNYLNVLHTPAIPV